MPFPIIPVLAAGATIASTALQNRAQKMINRSAFGMSIAQEQKIFERDSAYNSPAAQMARLRAAGLSPHLMYGQGTVGNTSGHNVQMQPYQYQGYDSVVPSVAQAFGVESQVRLKNAERELKVAQRELVKSNPYLSPGYVDALVESMKSIAAMKSQEAGFKTSASMEIPGQPGSAVNPVYYKMQNELDLLFQKFQLGEKDKEIKAKILESKEFQNALSEIQLKWMRDAEITPQHIFEGIRIMLMKMR